MHRLGMPPAVIVVDDEAESLLVLRMLLRGMTSGVEQIAVDNAQHALAIVRFRPVRLLITDYMMPGLNGLELAAAVKQISPTNHIVMFTVHDSAELKQQALASGADTYMMKPFPLRRLEDIIRQVV